MNAGFVPQPLLPGQENTAPIKRVTNFPGRYLRFGEFCLDVQKQELWKAGVYLRVAGKVYQALVMLLESPGEIVTREALRARLWPREGQLNYEANVNTTVNKLRQVLGDTDQESRFIETIPRRGYSFIARVEYADAAPVAALTEEEGPHRVQDSEKSLLFGVEQGRVWFTAAMVALMIAAMLFGAAITIYSRRGF
jgi:DNA-binding winged helix-turn-helix (wHTH) protein